MIEIEADAERVDAALARIDQFQKTAARPEPWMQKRASTLASAGRLPQSRNAWQALIDHLEALPAAQRESHAMTLMAEHARAAIQVLASMPPAPASSNPFPA
ncbi:MAG: hypothetical protein HC767_13155 [Akkermansiaceae bacterium]|nr:hypothetical protein [Akkermansiaceae bacterium]